MTPRCQRLCLKNSPRLLVYSWEPYDGLPCFEIAYLTALQFGCQPCDIWSTWRLGYQIPCTWLTGTRYPNSLDISRSFFGGFQRSSGWRPCASAFRTPPYCTLFNGNIYHSARYIRNLDRPARNLHGSICKLVPIH
jgi:hypothetical protein